MKRKQSDDDLLVRTMMRDGRREGRRRGMYIPLSEDEIRTLRRRWSRILFVLILAGGGLAAWLLEVGSDGWQGPVIGVGMIVALGYVYNRFGPPV